MSSPPRRSPVEAVALAASTTAVVMLPAFLTGATAVEMAYDLRFTAAQLGIALGLFRLTGAATGLHLGRVADRTGAIRSLRRGCLVAATCSVGIALFARNWPTLVVLLVLGGVGSAFGHPAANRLLIQRVDPRWLGRALGLKQSAPPFASMLAGLSVPLVALTLGWRWAFGIAAILAMTPVPFMRVKAVNRAMESAGRHPTGKLRDRPTVAALAVAVFLTSTAVAPVAAFYVSAAVAAGDSSRRAGFLLAIGSVSAIGVRLLFGIVADRLERGHLRLCAALVASGALGLALLAAGTPVTMAAGVVLALGAGWGYNALFWFAVLSIHHDTPATISGTLSAATLGGSALGPMIFGALVDGAGYPTAWMAAATMAVAGTAAFLGVSRRVLRQSPS